MILWIDDLRDPAAFGRSAQTYHWAKTNTEAIRIIDDLGHYIEGFAIDHDKCHKIPVKEFDQYFGCDCCEVNDFVSDLTHNVTCDETFEASVRYIALWAKAYDKRNVPIEIITSNTTKVDSYERILQSTGNRFVITRAFGGVLQGQEDSTS